MNEPNRRPGKARPTALINLTIIYSLLLILYSCSGDPTAILYTEEFNGATLPANLFIEGSQKVAIEEGRLVVDAVIKMDGDIGMNTTWINKKFSGDLKVEFDACVLSSPGEQNNINFFFLFSDTSGKSLLETSALRADASYKKYHQLNGYVITFLANGNPDTARFRLRDDPGFHLVQENKSYECRQNKIYKITVTKSGNHLTYAVDGVIFLDFVDDQHNAVHEEGLIGFRTWRTKLWWDNIKVTQL